MKLSWTVHISSSTLYLLLLTLFVWQPDPDDLQTLTGQKRALGRVVIRGPQVSLISPEEGMEEIANPFLAAEEDEEGEE